MEMLSDDRRGFVLSGSVHAALLVATLISFTHAKKFDDAQEAVPVETVTDQQFNQVLKGEKTAQEVKPTPKADKVAELTETKPEPPLAEAKRDIPTPPPPLKRIADPGEAQTPDVPTPPQRTVVTPPEPPKPQPKVEPPKVEPVKPPPLPPVAQRPPPPDAEALTPKPPPRPETPKPEPKKPEFKPDQLAKLLEQAKQQEAQKAAEKPAPTPPKSRPKSGEENEETHHFDAADINRLLSKEAPQRRASTAGQLQQVASLGAPNASAAKMSPSLWGQLDALLQDQYKQCWSYIGLPNQQKYVPEVKVQYAQNGTLIGQPVLKNPPTDPALRSLAESAIRAVRRCNPLNIPAVFQPFYDEWRDRIVRFDPDELS